MTDQPVRDFLTERYEPRTISVDVGPPSVPHDEGVPLQAWMDAHNAWDGAARRQVEFMRDTVTLLFTGHYNGWAPGIGDGPVDGWPAKGSDPDYTCMVVGEHTSKSVRLPVFSLRSVTRDIEARFRYNFYDWKMSVCSGGDGFRLDDRYGNLISRDKSGRPITVSSCYCEGFTDDWVFDPPGTAEAFTVEVYDAYQVWAVCWLLLGDTP